MEGWGVRTAQRGAGYPNSARRGRASSLASVGPPPAQRLWGLASLLRECPITDQDVTPVLPVLPFPRTWARPRPRGGPTPGLLNGSLCRQET